MNREEIDFLVIENLAGMVWVANLAGLELHTPQGQSVHAGGKGHRPAGCSISIRARPAGIAKCQEVACLLREELAADGLTAYPKTSGSKACRSACRYGPPSRAHLGIRAGVGRQAGRETSQADHRGDGQGGTARASLRGLEPEQHGQTTICVYSLRARPEPRVSTPVTWEEVEGEQPLNFTAPDVLERVERLGDLHADTLDAATPLPG